MAAGGHVYHIMNRANGELVLFEGPTQYRDFLHLLAEAADASRMRILAYCLMPNHWHMVVWPREANDLRRFVQRFTIRHAHHWHLRNGSVGRGHLYQGRYKSCLVEDERYLLTVCRYVERNPVRALLVGRAELWPWSSARLRAPDANATENDNSSNPVISLEPMLVAAPTDWLRWVNEPQTDAELHRLRLHVRSGATLGGKETPNRDEEKLHGLRASSSSSPPTQPRSWASSATATKVRNGTLTPSPPGTTKCPR